MKIIPEIFGDYFCEDVSILTHPQSNVHFTRF